MAKTREKNFFTLMSSLGKIEYNTNTSKPKREDICSAMYDDECIMIFKKLGGISEDYPLNIGSYDFMIENKFVELDEEAHFNRYRKITLSSEIYKNSNYINSEKYVEYCNKYENSCLEGRSFGGYWTNSSTEKQFGKPSPNGMLSGNGSPRWKQRAFYDFIKDLVPYVYGIPVIRISIYDILKDAKGRIVSVDQILRNMDKENAKLIYEFIISSNK